MKTAETKNAFSGEEKQNNSHHIISILGGITTVLNDYLTKTRTKQLNLSETKRKRLQRIEMHHPSISDVDNPYNFYYNFVENDNLLFAYFSNKTATFITKIGNSTIIRSIVGFSILFDTVISLFPDYSVGTTAHLIYSTFFNGFIWIPYIIYVLSILNLSGLKMSMSAFEVLFKIWSAIYFTLAMWLDQFILQRDLWNYFFFGVINRTLYGISVILAVVAVSCFDAFHISYKWKSLISGLLALAFGTWSISTMFAVENEYTNQQYQYINRKIIHITSFYVISPVEIQISTMRTLSIFFWRQCVLSLLRKDKKALKYSKSPSILWYGNDKSNITSQDIIELLKSKNTNKFAEEDVGIVEGIIDCLGGIDLITSNYLNNDDNKPIEPLLDDDNINILTKLYQLIERQQKLKPKDMIYCLNEKDTFLVRIFSNSTKIQHFFSTKIIQNKLFLLWVSIMVTIYVAVQFYESSKVEGYIEWVLITQIIIIIIGIPIFSLFLLSANYKGFIAICKTFTFWLKIVDLFIFCICLFLQDILIGAKWYNYIEKGGVSILLILIVFGMAGLDAFNWPIKLKIIILTTFSLGWWSYALFLIFVSMGNEEIRNNSIYILIPNVCSISALSLKISSCRILAIFIMKQTYNTMTKGRKNKGVLIKYVPSIKWYCNNKIQEDVHNAIQISKRTNVYSEDQGNDEDIEDQHKSMIELHQTKNEQAYHNQSEISNSESSEFEPEEIEQFERILSAAL